MTNEKLKNTKRLKTQWNLLLSVVVFLNSSLAFSEEMRVVNNSHLPYSLVPFNEVNNSLYETKSLKLDYYRSLGLIEKTPISITAQEIQASIQRGFPEILSSNPLNYDEFNRRYFNEGVRESLKVQINQAYSLVAQSTQLIGQSGSDNIMSRFNHLVESELKSIEQWNKSQNGNKWSFWQINEYATLRAQYRIIIKELSEKPDLVKKAHSIWKEASQVLSDSKSRTQYDVKNGFRNFDVSKGVLQNVTQRGSTLYINIPDPDNNGKLKVVKMDIPSQEEVLKVKPSDLAKDLALGTFKYTMLSGAILSLIHSISYLKLMTDYSANPAAVEDSYDEYFNLIHATSIATFFMGSQLADWSLFRKNVNYGYQLTKDNKIFSKNPVELKKAKFTALSNMSLGGMTVGLLASMVTLAGGKHLSACLPLFNERPIRERPMSEKKKQELEQMCNQAWYEYVLSYRNQFFIMWAALASTQTIMTFGAPAGAATYKTVKGYLGKGELKPIYQNYRDLRVQHLEVAGKGTKIKSVKMALQVGMRGALPLMATFAVLSGVLWGGGEVYNVYTVHRPVSSDQDKLQQEFLKLSNNKGLITNEMCDDSKINCGLTHFQFLVEKAKQSLDKWRQLNFSKVEEANVSWGDYYMKALNEYRAAYIFYRDLILQIADYRKRLSEFKENPFKLSVANVARNRNEGNFLLKSSPFFGMISDGPLLPSPLYQGQTWSSISNAELVITNENLNLQWRAYLKVIKELEVHFRKIKSKMPSNQAKKINEVITLSQSQNLEDKIKSFYFMQESVRQEPKSCPSYLSKLNNNPDLINKSQNLDVQCFMSVYYYKLSDKNIWGGKQFPFQAGYKTSSNDDLNGAKTLGGGQAYLIDMDHAFAINGVDFGWYAPTFMGNEMKSMAEYLVLTSLCGPEAKNSFEKPSWWKWGYRPVFTAPQLPLNKRRFDFCSWYLKEGFKQPHKIWTEFEDVTNGKVYYGVLDYLSQHLSDSVLGLNEFESWWDQEVRPSIEDSLKESSLRFEKDVINGKLKEALYRDDKTASFWEYIGGGRSIDKGYLGSLKAESDLYFSNILEIFIQNFKAYNSKTGQALTNVELQNYFSKLKAQYDKSLDELVKYNGKSNEELTELIFIALNSLSQIKSLFGVFSEKSLLNSALDSINYEVEKFDSIIKRAQNGDQTVTDEEKEVINNKIQVLNRQKKIIQDILNLVPTNEIEIEFPATEMKNEWGEVVKNEETNLSFYEQKEKELARKVLSIMSSNISDVSNYMRSLTLFSVYPLNLSNNP